jgi:hypothetical protein
VDANGRERLRGGSAAAAGPAEGGNEGARYGGPIGACKVNR